MVHDTRMHVVDVHRTGEFPNFVTVEGTRIICRTIFVHYGARQPLT